MFSLACIITIESTAQIEAQWSVQSTCFHCRQMWPHTDLTSASCCVPCRHAIPTVCLLDHSSTAAHSGDAFSATTMEVTERQKTKRLLSFHFILVILTSRTWSLLVYKKHCGHVMHVVHSKAEKFGHI